MSQYDWIAKEFDGVSFTAFDTETTGLDPRACRVVEVGGIRFDSRGISARFNTLIDPGVPMPAEVTRINGITDAMLAGQPKAEAALADFLRFAGNAVLVAHNAPFDVSFVNEELARLGKPALKNRVVDTRIFARDMFPGLPNYKLQDLAVRFGITAIDAHRAEDDARVCMELFLVCLAALRDKLHLVSGLAEAAAGGGSAAVGAGTAGNAANSETAGNAGPASGKIPVVAESEAIDLFDDEMGEEENFDENIDQ
jgi:DNA polymerase III subunit epsilon